MLNRSPIVCPVEASSSKGRAAVLAPALARLEGVPLHFLYVPRRRGDDVPARLRDRLAIAGGGDVQLRIADECTDPTKAVASYARREGATLVVIDQRYGESRAWTRRASVARRLARSAPCPVLVVPAAGTGRHDPVRPRFREVVCAVDFSDASAVALLIASALVYRSRGRLTLVHALENSRPRPLAFSSGEAVRWLGQHQARLATAARRLMQLAPARDLGPRRVEPFVSAGAPHEAILRAAAETKADLIVMGLVGRSLVSELVEGSTVRGVLRRAPCPILLVRALHKRRSEAFGPGAFSRRKGDVPGI